MAGHEARSAVFQHLSRPSTSCLLSERRGCPAHKGVHARLRRAMAGHDSKETGDASMKTRAAVAWKAGEPLTIETIDIEGPKAGEVLVEIKATGICHTDAYTLSGADPEGLFP